MNGVVIVIFFSVLLVMGTLILLFGGETPASQLRKRARGLRHRKAGGKSASAAAVMPTSLKRTQAQSLPLVEAIAKRFLPRQSELRDRLSRTGYDLSIGNYLLINVAVAAVVFAAMLIVGGLPYPVMGLLALACGVILPHIGVGYLAGRRRNKFMGILPDAVELIVRGLKSGLPVTESVATVGREMPEPLGGEFRRIADSVRFGRQLEDILWETARRLDTPEFNFFVISLSIQQETGGNLAETLANLAEILRKRKAMRLKVRALSSEARASAWILGAMPFIMWAAFMALDPDYASMLYTDLRGQMMACVGLLSLGMGVAIMAKMVKFEI